MPTTATPGWVIASHIPSHIENQRWIVDLFQLCGVGGIIHADEGNTGRRHASQFVMRQFHGLAGAERLRRDGLHAG